jgi:hypothetical protein
MGKHALEQTDLPISAVPPASTRVNVDASPRVDVDGVPTGVGGGALDALRHP